jgi:hypothetical protein
LVQLDLALELFFFAMSVLVLKLPSTVKFIPDQCNMTCYPANVIVSGVARNVVVAMAKCCQVAMALSLWQGQN